MIGTVRRQACAYTRVDERICITLGYYRRAGIPSYMRRFVVGAIPIPPVLSSPLLFFFWFWPVQCDFAGAAGVGRTDR